MGPFERVSVRSAPRPRGDGRPLLLAALLVAACSRGRLRPGDAGSGGDGPSGTGGSTPAPLDGPAVGDRPGGDDVSSPADGPAMAGPAADPAWNGVESSAPDRG